MPRLKDKGLTYGLSFYPAEITEQFKVAEDFKLGLSQSHLSRLRHFQRRSLSKPDFNLLRLGCVM